MDRKEYEVPDEDRNADKKGDKLGGHDYTWGGGGIYNDVGSENHYSLLWL